MKHRLQLLMLLVAFAILAPPQSALAESIITEFPYTVADLSSEDWQYKASNSNFVTSVTTSGNTATFKLKSGSFRFRYFSPQLELKAGWSYTVTFKAKQQVRTDGMDIIPLLTTEIFAGILSSNTDKIAYQGDQVSTTNMAYHEVTFTYAPTVDQTLYFGLDVIPSSSKERTTEFTAFSITAKELVKKPLPIENLTAKCEQNGSRDITLSWTNPSKYETGEDLSIAGIKVLRNSELYTTLTDASLTAAGQDVSWTDTPEASGEYEYTLSVLDADGKESDNLSVKTPYVGKPDPITPPHTFDFSSTSENSFWTITTEEGANGWAFDSSYLQCTRNGSTNTASTATTPLFILDANKAYKLSYNAQCTNKANEFGYQLTLTENADDQPQTTELVNVDIFTPTANNTNVATEVVFSPKASGEAQFNFIANLEKLTSTYYTNTFKVSNLTVEEIPVVPMIATNLKAEENINASAAVKLTWDNPDKSETGLLVTDLKATIYRDNTEVATIDVTAGESAEFTDDATTGLNAGYHTYYVTIDNANGHTSNAPEKIETGFIGSATELPYAADFSAPELFKGSEPNAEKANGAVFVVAEDKATLKDKTAEIDDALIAPPVKLSAGHVYEITVTSSHTSYYDTNFDVILAPRDNASDLSNILAQSTFKAGAISAKFSIDNDGEYFPVIYAHAASYGSSVNEYTISEISISESALVPDAPTEILAKANYNAANIRLSWKMPSCTPEKVTLTESMTGKLYRGTTIEEDAEPLTTFEAMPGKDVEYLDTAPEDGINNYVLVLSNPSTDALMGGDSAPVLIASDYYAATITPPYKPDFNTEEGRSGWTFIDDSSTYNQGNTFSFNDENMIYILDGTSATSTSSRMNDWVVSPLFLIEDSVTYDVTIVAKCSGTSSYYMTPFEIYLGGDKTSAALKAGYKITDSTAPRLTNEFAEYSYSFTINGKAESQNIRRAENDGDNDSETSDDEEATTTETFSRNMFVGILFGLTNYCYPEVTIKSISFDSNKATPSGIDTIADNSNRPLAVVNNTIVGLSADAAISIYATSGRLVAMSKGNCDLSELPSGVYIIRAVDKNAVATLKFVKH